MFLCDCKRRFYDEKRMESCKKRGHQLRFRSSVVVRPYVVVFLNDHPATLVFGTADSAIKERLKTNYGLKNVAVVSRADYKDTWKLSKNLKLEIPQNCRPWALPERKIVWKNEVLP